MSSYYRFYSQGGPARFQISGTPPLPQPAPDVTSAENRSAVVTGHVHQQPRHSVTPGPEDYGQGSPLPHRVPRLAGTGPATSDTLRGMRAEPYVDQNGHSQAMSAAADTAPEGEGVCRGCQSGDADVLADALSSTGDRLSYLFGAE